jgi:hypothetical protein
LNCGGWRMMGVSEEEAPAAAESDKAVAVVGWSCCASA